MSEQTYVLVWKIQNFSNSFHETGKPIVSPAFTIESLKKSQWFLKIYPRGGQEESKEFISIYLNKKKNDILNEDIEANFQIEMIGGDGNIIETLKCEKKIFGSWGWTKFKNIKNVTDEIKGWPADVITLRCSIFYNIQQNRPECEGRTEIGIDRQSVVWNVRVPDASSQILKKELHISEESVFEIIINMPEDALKIVFKPKNESPAPKSVNCKMSLVDSKGRELISESDHHFFEANDRNDAWEFPVFITKKFLDDNKTAFVEIDTICLLCKWVSSNGKITDTVLGSSCDLNSCSTLQMEFKNMLLDSTYSDVKLKAGNEEVKAHKCVLAARSPVFSSMFQQDMIESKTNTVNISDVEANTLKSFLKFVYTETLDNLDCGTAKKLLLVAEKYQVLTLKEKCVVFLESVLSLGNVLEILSVADMIGHERLKCAAVNIIVLNSEVVLNLPEWSTLIQNNTKLATEIISKIVCSKNGAN